MSHYDIHVGDVIKYPEMVMARTVKEILINVTEIQNRAFFFLSSEWKRIMDLSLLEARALLKYIPDLEVH